MSSTFLQEARRIHGQIVTWRRELHQIPEVGITLPQTMGYIKKQLEEMGISCQYHEAISCIGR